VELRLILILIGAVIIAAVWLFSRQRSSAERSTTRSAPTLDEDEFSGDDLPSKTVPGASAKTAPIREQGEQLILALHVMPRAAAEFPGATLQATLEACGLKFGRYKVYHRLEGAGADAASVFSVANVVEPGSFDPATLAESSFPGLTISSARTTAFSTKEARPSFISPSENSGNFLPASVEAPITSPSGSPRWRRSGSASFRGSGYAGWATSSSSAMHATGG